MQNERVICNIIDSIRIFKRYFVSFDENLEIRNGVLKVAIAVSGGIDSMALLHGMILLRNELNKGSSKVVQEVSKLASQNLNEIDITCVTVNHNLRSDSLENANFVKNFCERMNVKCEILDWNWKVSEGSNENGCSDKHSALSNPGAPGKHSIFSNPSDQRKINQDIARNARYDLIKHYCSKNEIRVLFLGHHLQDQIETFIMRLRRKSGLYGLGCMSVISCMNAEFENSYCSAKDPSSSSKSSSNSTIYMIRPFLQLKKHELRHFLMSHNVNWYEDISNTYEKYERVRVRNAIKNERKGEAQDEKGGVNDGIESEASLSETLLADNQLPEISFLESRMGSIVQKLSHRRFMAEIIAKKAFRLVRKIDFALNDRVLSRAIVVNLEGVQSIMNQGDYKNTSWRVFAESIYYGLSELGSSISHTSSGWTRSGGSHASSASGASRKGNMKSSFITRKNLNELVGFLSSSIDSPSQSLSSQGNNIEKKECVNKANKERRGCSRSTYRSTFVCKNLIWIRSGSSLFVFNRNATKNATKSANNDFFKVTDIYQRLMCVKNNLTQLDIVNFWNICVKKHLFDYGGDYARINTSFVLVNNFFLSKNFESFARKVYKLSNLKDLILTRLSEKKFKSKSCKDRCRAGDKVEYLSETKFLHLFLNFLLLNLSIEFMLNKFFTKSDLSYIKEKFFKNTSFLYIFLVD